MKKGVKILSLLLACLCFSGLLVSCKGNGGTNSGDEVSSDGVLIGDASVAAEKYADVDFGGKKLTVHMNTLCQLGYDSSIKYMRSPETLGDAHSAVEEEVFKRDIWMKENLNMDVQYVTCEVSYDAMVKALEPLLISGDTEIDLYVNNMYPMAMLAVRGYFANVANRPEINYYEKYWYGEFMNSLSLDDGNSTYLLAGDYFMDVIQAMNIMVVNTYVLDEHFADRGGANAFLQTVMDGGFTYELMYEYMQGVYVDGADMNDATYGFVIDQIWQNMMPMVVSANLDFTYNSNGTLKSALNNQKSSDLYDIMVKIFDSKATTPMLQEGNIFESALDIKPAYKLFAANRGLFGSGRFAYLPLYAELDINYSVLPYPKLDAEDNYYTAVDHITMIGAIPGNCSDISTVLQMLEIFCERTSATVMEKYYDDGLKLRYSADTTVSQIVDLVHDNVGSGFALAYDGACGSKLVWGAFYLPYCNNRQSFVTNYQSIETAINSALKTMQKQWNSIEQ